MNNDEKIVKTLEKLQVGQERLEKAVTSLQGKFQKGTKRTNRKLKSIHNDIELVLKYHDEMYMQQCKRIERIEKHVGLPVGE
jgi:hypothetical protein